MAMTEPIRNKEHIRALCAYYLKRKEPRNYLLFVLGIHTGLRICDILRLSWDDVYDFERKHTKKTMCITEKKTGKTKIIALNKQIILALQIYLSAAAPGQALILNKNTGEAISRVQAHRLLSAASKRLQLGIRISCHSLRKTFGYHAWKKGVSPAVIMEIFNHSSLAVTKRYLGISQDDLNKVYLKLAFST